MYYYSSFRDEEIKAEFFFKPLTFCMYINVESLHCAPETKIISYASYTSIKNNQ